jgi:hypothetical protein
LWLRVAVAVVDQVAGLGLGLVVLEVIEQEQL